MHTIKQPSIFVKNQNKDKRQAGEPDRSGEDFKGRSEDFAARSRRLPERKRSDPRKER